LRKSPVFNRAAFVTSFVTKIYSELFKRQGVSIAYMGSTDGKSVLSVFDTNDVDEFMRIFNDPATAEAMANDKITGGVELFVLDESFSPQ
jgi:hypothetical protein